MDIAIFFEELFGFALPGVSLFPEVFGVPALALWVAMTVAVWRYAREWGVQASPWGAILPIGQERLLGRVADTLAPAPNGKARHTRRLTGWAIAARIAAVVGVLLSVLLVVFLVRTGFDLFGQKDESGNTAGAAVTAFLLGVLALILTAVILLTVAVFYLVLHIMRCFAVYPLFLDCVPNYAVLFEVLYALLPPVGVVALLILSFTHRRPASGQTGAGQGA